MSKKQILTLILALTALTAEIVSAAGMPANVTQVAAEKQGTTVRVTWAPVEGAAFYRVYFSHQSILDNEGNYDDFERTTDATTSYTFVKLPLKSDAIFFGVLAVDADGAESEGFETEASVNIAADDPAVLQHEAVEPSVPGPDEQVPPSEGEMPGGESPTSTAEPMAVMSVQSVSATGVIVVFTKNIHPDADVTPDTFLLTDSGGTTLAITDVHVDGSTVMLSTDTQTPAKEYLFGLLRPVQAEDGTNVTPSMAQVVLQGFGDAMEPATQQKPEPAVTQPPVPYGKPPSAQPPVPYGRPPVGQLMDSTYLDLNAVPRQDGTYDITARWNPANGAQTYGLYTSVNGMGYAWNGQVAGNQTSVVYGKVKPGTFALRLTTKDANGQESRGIERAVNLPTTGLGLLGIMGAAGATAGMRLRRRKTEL